MNFNMLISFMETPKLYGWYHIMWVVIIAILGVVTITFTRKQDDRQTRIFLIAYLVIMVTGEIIKQFSYAMYGHGQTVLKWHWPWETFPLQFCTTPLYVVPLALLFKKLKKEKLYQTMLTYLGTFSFFSATILFTYPADVFTPRIGTNIQTMVQHGMMVLFGLHIIKAQRLGGFKDFLKATYLFIIFITVALIFNVSFHNLSNKTINLFYISPYHESIFPIIGRLQNIDYLLFLIAVIIGIVGTTFIIYLIGTYMHIPLKYVKVGIKYTFKNPWGRYVLLGLFILLNILGSSLFFNNTYFSTLVFPNVPFGYKLNAIVSDLLFLSLIYFTVCFFIKNTKGRLYTLLFIGVFLSGYNLAQAISANAYQYMYVPEFLLFKQTYIKAISIFEYVIDYTKFIFANKLYRFFIPQLVFLFFIRAYLGVNKKEIIYEKYKKGEHEILLRFINKRNKVKRTFKTFITANKKLVYGLSFILIFLMFVGFQANAFSLIKKTEVYSGNENLKPHVAGYLSYPLTMFYENDTNKERDYSIDTIKKFDRNINNIDRIDDFGNSIGIEELNNVQGFNNLEELKAVFKDKNIYFIQLETFMQILLAQDENNIFHKYIKDLVPEFFSIYDNSYRFSNFYDLIGIGTSSDATLAIMGGVIPSGSLINSLRQTIKPTNMPFALPKILNENGYDSMSFVGSHPKFYNEDIVFGNLYGMNKLYYATEDKNYLKEENKISKIKRNEKASGNLILNDSFKDLRNNKNKKNTKHENPRDNDNPRLMYHNAQWSIDDKQLFYAIGEMTKDYTGKHILFAETQYPHVPFNYLRPEDKAFGHRRTYRKNKKGKMVEDEKIIYPELDELALNMQSNEYKMFQYLGYINRYFKSFKENILPLREKDSIFIFYGDHGNQSFSKKSYDALFGGVKQDYYKYRSDMKKVVSFIYAADTTKEKVNGVHPGKLVGEQNLLRSQKDIYGTLLELLDIKNPTYTLYNNLFTKTKGIAICPKHFLIFGDDFAINNKIKNKNIYWFNKDSNLTNEDIYILAENQREIKKAFEQLALKADYSCLLKND